MNCLIGYTLRTRFFHTRKNILRRKGILAREQINNTRLRGRMVKKRRGHDYVKFDIYYKTVLETIDEHPFAKRKNFP
jgi:hypothetical protein